MDTTNQPANGNNDRREFIKKSSLLAAGGLLLSNIPVNAFSGSADTIKIALIGCGGRGTGATVQALNTKSNVKLVAMADVFRDNIDKSYDALLTKFGKEKVAVAEDKKFVGFDAYKQAIAEADVVLLTTSIGFRPFHFEEAVRQGKHVFMEKPLAVDAPGVRMVLAAAEEAKRKKLNVVVGLQRRYQNCYRETIKRIRNGAVGDIVSGEVYWISGGVWVRPRTAGQTEMEYQMRNWYYFNWLSGDHITEQHVHNLDVANWVKNSYPVSAQGTGSRFLRTGKDSGEIFDNHSVVYKYADGSVIFSQARHYEGTMNRVDESFQGTSGRVYLSANHTSTGMLWNAKGKLIYNHDAKTDPDPYQAEHDELFAAVAAGKYVYADAEHAAKSTMTAVLGRMATYSGKEIKWDDAINSKLTQMPDRLAWDVNPKVMPDANGNYPHAIPGKTKVV